MSYVERQRSPSDRGLPGRPAMTPSSGVASGVASRVAAAGVIKEHENEVAES